ncbi:MAG: adenylate/guanylate cyclase domain-containing protein [Pseudomonadota bacterium]
MALLTALRRHGRRLLAVATIVAMAALGTTSVADRLSGQVFDTLSTTGARTPETPGAIIVAVDEPSFSAIGQQWPWPRDLHAQLIESLRRAGAKAIAFDVVFAEPSTAEADGALSAVAARDILFAADESITETPQGSAVIRTEPLPQFLAQGARLGIASLAMDGDGVIRGMPRYPDGFAARLAGKAPAKGERMIQYLGPAGSYPRVSYYQALDPERFLPPGIFKGRTVIIGYALQTAPSIGAQGADSYETSWSAATGVRTPGVEVQATIFDNLVHGLEIAPAGRALTIAVALLAGVIAWVVTGARLPLVQAVLVFVALGTLYLLSLLLLAEGRLWLSPVPATMALLGTALVLAGFDFALEQRRRREIIGAFGRYVSPLIVERLIANPDLLNLGGETRDMTILFADIRGFSAIAEGMKDNPQRLTQMINAILTPMSDIVLSHGGTIDKFMGDCIMAFWNAPLDERRHALRGYEAAMAIAEVMPRIDADLQAQDPTLPHIRVGIGVNSGFCVVGNMGSTYRFDYSVLGDAVNVASRLEGLCDTYGVPLLMGEETAARLPVGCKLREVDRIAVRGRETPLSIFAPAA